MILRRFKWYYVKFMKKQIVYHFFSKPRDFVNGPDLVAQSTGKALWNPLTKIRSYTNHAWKWVLRYKLLWFYWNVVLINIFTSWRLVIFLLLLLNEIRLHLWRVGADISHMFDCAAGRRIQLDGANGVAAGSSLARPRHRWWKKPIQIDWENFHRWRHYLKLVKTP